MPSGKTIARAAGFLMVTTLVARILGYVRDMVIYSRFGQSYVTDAYNAAFSIPDFIYMLLVGGALSSAFIPVFSGYLARGEKEEAFKVASIILNFTLLVLLILMAVALLFTRSLVLLLVPKLPDASVFLAIDLTRIMVFQTFFMALSGIVMGVLNSNQHFTSPALGGIVYNLFIIGLGLAFAPRLGIMAFSVGVVVGAFANLAVQIPALGKYGFKYLPSLELCHPGFKQVMMLMAPMFISLSVAQFNLLVNQNLASGLPEGSISALRLAQRIMQLPVGVFAVSMATAVFPTLTLQAAKEDKEAFGRTLNMGLRMILLISIPAGVGLMAVGRPLISLLFQQGKFDFKDVIMTSQSLSCYSLGLFAYSLQQVLLRAFYALKNTVTPVVVGVCSVVLNIILSLLLVEPLKHQGLALAYSLAGVANILLLLAILRKNVDLDVRPLLKTTLVAFLASLSMYLAVRGTIIILAPILTFADKVNHFIIVLTGIGIGMLVYFVVVWLCDLEEIRIALDMFKDRFGKYLKPGP